jgi:hypothetical protein
MEEEELLRHKRDGNADDSDMGRGGRGGDGGGGGGGGERRGRGLLSGYCNSN